MSELNFKDYAGFYMGCRCVNAWFLEDHPEYNRGWYLRTFRTAIDTCNPYGIETLDQEYITSTDSIKPILRLTKDMTDDDIKSFIGYERLTRLYQNVSFSRFMGGITINYSIDTEDEGLYPQSYDLHFQRLDSLQFHRLLKAGFDMFSLIKNGLAIDSKTLK